MTKLEKLLLSINLTTFLLLVIYSYSFVDLNLTLSTISLVNQFVGNMQQLGYFHRPVSTLIYSVFIISTFNLFIMNLFFVYKKKVGLSYLVISVAASTFLLIFSYPFLSADIFNYMFDAKIITEYGSNPYTHRALDFPNDEWTRFMRWTHRYSPYGPVWIGFTIIPAILSFGKFTLNLFLLKFLVGIFHLLNAFLIYRILKSINPGKASLGTVFYALNPVILIEGIANSHNDIIIATSLLISIYFITIKKNIFSLSSLIIGTLIKYIPVLNLPWLIYLIFSKKKNVKLFIYLSLSAMVIFTIIFSSIRISVPFVSSGATQVQFQPWYLLWSLPLVALIPKNYLLICSFLISLGASFRYIPYLYYGDWSHQYTLIFMQLAIFIPIVISLFLFGWVALKKR